MERGREEREDHAPEDAAATDLQFWVMSRGRLALHWVAVLLMLVALAAAARYLVVDGLGSGAWALGLVAAFFLVRLLRAVTAVWLDPDGTLTLFRAAGGAIRTRPEHVRGMDHGWVDAYYRSPNRSYTPSARIVTDDGTGSFSPFFKIADEVGDAIINRNPDAHIDL